jgi:type IV pilus assembly protein PilC
MNSFNYIAVGDDGKKHKGTVTAADRNAARALVVKQGLKPISITSARKFSLNMQLGEPKVRLKDRVVFTRQLATLINAGVALPKSLNTLTLQSESKALKIILPSIVADVEGGKPLADALAKFPKTFDKIYVNMVKAGEAGGILDDILERLALQQEKDAEIRGKLKSAMTYPGVILSITVIAFIYLMTTVVPKIGQIVTDLGGEEYEPPIYTKILLGISYVMVNYGIFLVVGIGIGGFLAWRFFHSEKGRPIFDTMLLRTPVLGKVIAKVAIARFARIFSALNASGVAVLESLRITGQALGNEAMRKVLDDAAEEIKAGKPLSEPLSKSRYFPPVLSQMIAVGEETGDMESVLLKLADFYDREVDDVANSLTSILEPIMIVVLGGVIGMLALSVFGPISQLTQTI